MKNKYYFIVISTLLTCVFLALFEHMVDINYAIKTAAKICLFFLNVWIYIKLFNDFKFGTVFNTSQMNKGEWFRIIGLGVMSASIILIAYVTLKQFIDLTSIKNDLTERLGISASSFIFVGLYITFGNSLLEEYFFRGFIYANLPKKVAYTFSPLLFAFYHIPMIILWFNIVLIILCFIGLWIIGIIFLKVNEATETIWPSWIIHICADIMIILIGFNLFY